MIESLQLAAGPLPDWAVAWQSLAVASHMMITKSSAYEAALQLR